jgi:hypothetical protein
MLHADKTNPNPQPSKPKPLQTQTHHHLSRNPPPFMPKPATNPNPPPSKPKPTADPNPLQTQTHHHLSRNPPPFKLKPTANPNPPPSKPKPTADHRLRNRNPNPPHAAVLVASWHRQSGTHAYLLRPMVPHAILRIIHLSKASPIGHPPTPSHQSQQRRQFW